VSSQRGFTLMEVMASTAATALVIAAATAFLLKFLSWYDELSAKIAMNRHARETYELLAYGGTSGSIGKDGTNNVYGLREMNKAPGGPAGALRSDYALTLTSNRLTLKPDTIATMTINCSANGVPLPDCRIGGPKGGPDATQSVAGWLGQDVKVTAGPSAVGNTVQVSFNIINPFEIQRAANPSVFSENYHTIFTLNRGEKDP
jgi:prepilin-type N-terminal cleavage/methylation domain-containing protein